MFVNRISMPQTFLYNFFYNKVTRFLRQQVITVIVQHNSKFTTVHSWVTVGGCSMEFEYNFLRQFACAVACRMPYTNIISIYTTSLQGHTKSFWKKIPVRHGLFSKLVSQVSRSLSAAAAQFYSEIQGKTRRVALRWVALALFKP